MHVIVIKIIKKIVEQDFYWEKFCFNDLKYIFSKTFIFFFKYWVLYVKCIIRYMITIPHTS